MPGDDPGSRPSQGRILSIKLHSLEVPTIFEMVSESVADSRFAI